MWVRTIILNTVLISICFTAVSHASILGSKIYYICYREHVYPDRYMIDCTYKGWYSTNPIYNNTFDRINYHPSYVCPRNYASHSIQFNRTIDLNAWWRQHCYKWKKGFYQQRAIDFYNTIPRGDLQYMIKW